MGHKRSAETQRRLKKKYIGRYRVPIYFDEEKGIWRRWYWGKKGKNSYNAFLKKQSRRHIRRSKEVYKEKNRHHREFDYWWNLI